MIKEVKGEALNQMKAVDLDEIRNTGLSEQQIHYNRLRKEEVEKQRVYQASLPPEALSRYYAENSPGGFQGGYYMELIAQDWFISMSAEEQRKEIIKIHALNWNVIPRAWQTIEEMKELHKAGMQCGIQYSTWKKKYFSEEKYDYDEVMRHVEEGLIDRCGNDYTKW